MEGTIEQIYILVKMCSGIPKPLKEIVTDYKKHAPKMMVSLYKTELLAASMRATLP